MNFKFNVPEITEDCEVRLKILDMIEVLTKKKEEKIVAKVRPYDMKSDIEYADLQVWFDVVAGERESSFFDALGNPEKLEDAIGKYVGGTVTIKEVSTKEGVKVYRNVNSFFEVEQDPFVEAPDELPF